MLPVTESSLPDSFARLQFLFPAFSFPFTVGPTPLSLTAGNGSETDPSWNSKEAEKLIALESYSLSNWTGHFLSLSPLKADRIRRAGTDSLLGVRTAS